MKNNYRIAISLLLVIIFVAQSIVTCFAGNESKLYIKEIKISSADTEEKAKKWLTDNGYTDMIMI